MESFITVHNGHSDFSPLVTPVVPAWFGIAGMSLIGVPVIISGVPAGCREVTAVLSLKEVYLVIFTACGDFCGGFHHKSKSPHILVAVFATSPNHHKYLWRKPPQVQITTNPVAVFATSIYGLSGLG